MEKIYVLGTGTLALYCAEYAKKQGLEVLLFEMAEKKSMFLGVRAKKLGISYFHEEKEIVFQKLLEEKDESLLISAINESIVPAGILEKKNITAINLHQALLPKHPGRNAECWAIFEQEQKSGITWHFMEAQVDRGDVILQKEILLEEDMTAYTLFEKQIQAAKEAFNEIFDDLLHKTANRQPQEKTEMVKYHKSYELPNDGYLNLEWSGEKISAFLRSMDYSGLRVMEQPKLLYQNVIYKWKKYKIYQGNLKEKIVKMEGSDIKISKDGMVIVLENCTKCN